MAKVSWKPRSDPHDYPAASAYLSLLLDDPAVVQQLIGALPAVDVAQHKAKDILRAAQLALLPATNSHVAGDLRKIRRSKPLSQVLLVRGDLLRGFPLQIADGYHRVCASYHVDENTDIPCRIVSFPATPARTRGKPRVTPPGPTVPG